MSIFLITLLLYTICVCDYKCSDLKGDLFPLCFITPYCRNISLNNCINDECYVCSNSSCDYCGMCDNYTITHLAFTKTVCKKQGSFIDTCFYGGNVSDCKDECIWADFLGGCYSTSNPFYQASLDYSITMVNNLKNADNSWKIIVAVVVPVVVVVTVVGVIIILTTINKYKKKAHAFVNTDITNTSDAKIGKLKLAKYRFLKKLGKGGFGSVYLAEDIPNKRFVAVKMIEKIDFNEEEIKVRQCLNSRFLVQFYEIQQVEEQVIIVMEYCHEGDLRGYMDKIKSNHMKMKEITIFSILKQILLGLKEMHCKKIIHRDIKPENIFINDVESIRIGDFGISRPLNTDESKAQTLAGTRPYLAPEILTGMGYDCSVDVFSLGLVLYEMASGELVNVFNVFENLACNKRNVPEINSRSVELNEIILQMLQNNSKDRPTVEVLLSNNCLKNIIIKTN